VHFDKWISNQEWVKCIILHGGSPDLTTYAFNNAMTHSYGLLLDNEQKNDFGVYRHVKSIRGKCIHFYFVSKDVACPSRTYRSSEWQLFYDSNVICKSKQKSSNKNNSIFVSRRDEALRRRALVTPDGGTNDDNNAALA
jgi:hypothetical protein